MNIAMIAAECVPYAKTGGLADVLGALPQALRARGHRVIVIMPKYGWIDTVKYKFHLKLSSMGVWMGNTLEWCAVYQAKNNGVAVYFIEANKFFDRYGLYHDADNRDYLDNPRRYGFLTRAGLQLCIDLNFKPDIIHVHDWHTAIGTAYLKIWHWNDSRLGKAASVLTIHNIAYQGVYETESYDYLGLQWSNFTPQQFEDHGKINFLKGGIYYADMVNTVSPTYAKETRTPEYAHGLAPYLNDKGENYVGILNGADYSDWNPQTDIWIPARYSSENLAGKRVCKLELQTRFLLTQRDDLPVIGVVSRLVSQKGLDLLAQVIEGIVTNMQVQFVLLGSGDKNLEYFFSNLPKHFPGKIGCFIGYNNELSHLIEAGSDFFIMPSVYEPCGLNQIYSLKYGTLPIVRATGGLDDTIQQYDESSGEGTGFKFYDLNPTALYYVVGWAVSTYYDRRAHINKMIQSAMAQNFSWKKSAKQYELVYQRAIANHQQAM